MDKRIDYLSAAAAYVGILVSICSFGQLVPATIPGVASIVLCLALVVKSRKNRLVLFVSLIFSYAVYSIVCANYIFNIDSYFTIYANNPLALQALAGLLLFLSIIILLTPTDLGEMKFGDVFSRKDSCNQLFVLVLCIILLFVCAFGFGRPDQLGEARGEPSALFEYSSILFIAAYYYAGQSKRLCALVTCVITIFIIQNIIFGGRIIALQLFAVFFYFRLSPRMRDISCVAVLLIGFIILILVGNLRAEVVDTSLSDVVQSVAKVAEAGLTWDTAYSSWHTTLTFYLFKDAFSPDTLYLFFQWLLSMLLGGSAVVDSNLAEMTHEYYLHYFGGVLPGFASFYLGVLGIVLIAIYVSLLIRRVSYIVKPCGNKLNDVSNLCALYFVITTPRWFLYSPSPLFRGLLLSLIVFKTLEYLDRNFN